MAARAAGSTQSKGKKQRKFGRNSRAPSNQNQTYRTAKNKRLRTERATAQKANPKKLKVPRGTARRKRRFGVTRKATT